MRVVRRLHAARRDAAGALGSELDGRHEDKAELLRHVVELRGLDPEATWMVGDREHDVRAAKGAGVGSVGVTWGYGSAEELRAAGADVLCDSPAAVARTLATEA